MGRSFSRLALAAGVLFGASACGGSDYPDLDTPLPAAEPKKTEAPAPARPAGTLYRDEVDQTIDTFGAFLATHIDVEASAPQGAFQGWRIVSLRPAEFWEGVDLELGDVVTGVNGMPLERPEQAQEVLKALKQADTLVVEYQRGGEARRLTRKIVPRP
jgi:type II secretory pathway component PulC